jgi:hypothetical protein
MWLELDGRARGGCSVNIPPPVIGDPSTEQWIRVFEERIPQLLDRAIAAVPGEWYQDDIYALHTRLMWRLEAIRLLVDRDILRRTSIVRTM